MASQDGELRTDEGRRSQKQRRPGTRRNTRNELILSNLWRVESIAHRFKNRGMSWDDLLQEGACALVREADQYDLSGTCPFSAWVNWAITQGIWNALRDQVSLIALPEDCAEELRKVRLFRKKFLQKNGFAPSDRDMRDYFHLRGEKLIVFRQMMAARYPTRRVSDANPDAAGSGPQENVAVAEWCETLSRRLAEELNARQADVIRRRFGLGGCRVETLRQIGETYGLTRERVRQIESRSFKILKGSQETRELQLAARIQLYRQRKLEAERSPCHVWHRMFPPIRLERGCKQARSTART